MPKQIYPLRDFSGGLNNLKDPSDIADNELSHAQNIMFTQQGAMEAAFNMRDSTNNKLSAVSTTHINHIVAGYGLGYFETDHYADGATRTLTLTSGNASERGFLLATDGDKHYLGAFSDGNDKVDYNTGSSAPAGTALNLHNWFPTGTEIILSGMNTDTSIQSPAIASGEIDGIYTVVGGDGQLVYLDRETPATISTVYGGLGVGITLGIIGTVTGILSGDKILMVAHPAEHKIDVYSNSLTAYTEDSIILQDYSSDDENSNVLYYKVDESIRCCDTNINTQCKIKWFGWVSREHFVDSTAKATYSGYFSNDNTLRPPRYGQYEKDSGTALAYPTAGRGFNLKCFSSTTDALVPAATYEFAQSFIYDGNQESLLSHYSILDTSPLSTLDTTLAATDLKALSVQIGAQGPYDERISGGRIYIRESGTENEWIFLLDIDLSKGARTNLDGKYTSWKLASGDTHYIGASATTYMAVNELSLLNYEIINGFPSNVFSNDLGGQGEKWQDSTVANNRVFVCNVRMADKSKGENKIETSPNRADLTHFPDRIMYSMPHRYDTFPEMNTIEAAKGDADHYVAIESYADRLLAFKRKSMDIINISGESHNWFLEDTKQYVGVEHHAAVQKTQYGIIWANFNGLFLYDGSTIKDLTENKIDDRTWYTYISSNSIILYDEIKSLVYVIQNCASDGDAYMVDLKKNNFTFLADFAQDGITNPVATNITSNGQILVGYDAGSGVDFYQFYLSGQAQQQVQFETKELDFGVPNKQKKLYAVYITYKSNADISAKFKYSINGGVSWVAFSSGSSATSTTTWQKGKWSLTTPVTSSKFMLQLDTTTTSATVWINDIGFEYRTIHKRDG